MKAQELGAVDRPFLPRFAVERQDGADLPGYYDPQEAMWVVPTPQGSRPLIDVAADSTLEITTKTLQNVESDDDVPKLLALVTKTAQQPEADDESRPTRILLELETKTEAEVEQDDESRPVL